MRTRGADSAQDLTARITKLGADVRAGDLAAAASDAQSVTAASGWPMRKDEAQEFESGMRSLTEAIGAGDVGAAQAAFAKVATGLARSQVHQWTPPVDGLLASFTTQETDDPFAGVFGTLGSSLASDDLGSASAALTQLQLLLANAATPLTTGTSDENAPVRPGAPNGIRLDVRG
jgi:hypothetical protein